jgi:hypothetical protein
MAKNTAKSISKLLKGANEVSPVKKGTPTLTGHEQLADDVSQLKYELERAEIDLQNKEGQLLAIASSIYAQRAKSDFSKSFNFAGENSPGVQVVFADKFSEVPATEEKSLRLVLGAKFDEYFEESRSLALSKTDDATIALLLEKLGEETFLDIFNIKIAVKTKKDMDRKQFDLSEEVRSKIKQAKPGVKVIKE